MRAALLAFLLFTAVAFSVTILTRADRASVEAVQPVLLQRFPDVRIVPADPTQWRALIDRGEADFLWAGAPLLFESLYGEGRLQPMPDVPELRAMPDRLGAFPLKRYGPDGRVYWAAYALLGYVIGYNGEALARVGLRPPRTWADLASLDYAGYAAATGVRPVVLARPSKSTSAAAMDQLVLEIYGWERGWEILTATAAIAKMVDSSGAVRDTVMRGEAYVGPMVDYYAFLAGLNYTVPQDGTDLLVDPIAIPKGANYTAATELVRLFLSEVERQLVDRYILPANPTVLDDPRVNRTKAALLKAHLARLNSTRILAVPPERSASYYYSLVYYYEATLVDPQQQLSDLWTAAVSAYLQGRITLQQLEEIRRLMSAPLNFTDPADGRARTFTYQYAVEVNGKLAQDPAYRDRLYAEWRSAAVRRYQEARRALDQMLAQGSAAPQRQATQLTTAAAAATAAAAVLLAWLVRSRRRPAR